MLKKIKEILIMPPNLALLSTLNGSNYPCLELNFMVPKVFEPLKFYCKQLLSARDGIENPGSIAYWPMDSTLIIGCEIKQHVCVYNLVLSQ